MTRRACRLTVLTALKALQADLQGSFGMAGPFAKNSFLPAQRLQGLPFLASHLVKQTSTSHLARRAASDTARREGVAALVAEPILDGSAHREPPFRHAGFSSQSHHNNEDSKSAVVAMPTHTATTKAVKTDRRPGRKLRESQSKDAASNTDLRLIQGVGPKNEQLLLKTGHSSVARLKEVYKVDHREDKIALKRYLQDKVGIRPHHCTLIATDIKEKVDQELAEAGGPSTSQQTSRVTLCVEGNISAGKSTFLNWVAQGHPELDGLLEVVPEPVDRWQSVGEGSHNILDAFYEQPERYAYTFQNYVFVTRMMQEKETQQGERPFRLLERSVFSDRMVFVRAVHESKYMSDLELNIYDSWFDPVVQASPTLVPDGFIYLRATPDICMTRLKRRSRAEEAGVSLEYLQQLHQKHEDWLKLPKLWTPPPFPASDYTCQGQTLPDVLGKLRQDVDLHAVQEPPAIQGKVMYLNSSHSPGMPRFIDGVPTLVLDYDKEIDMARDFAARDEYAAQVKAYFEFVKAVRAKKEGDLRFAAITGELKGRSLTQATKEQVAAIQHMLTDGTLAGLPQKQKGVVQQQMLDLLGVGQQQPMRALAGCM